MEPETISPLATEFYNMRFRHYISQGVLAGEATERADMDLLEWSRPLNLPEPNDPYEDYS